jgi:hypothetical protein
MLDDSMFRWSFKFEKALWNLGASVSIMPRDVSEKLSLSNPEPTAMCLELGDNSIRYPLGIAVDVPVKVGRHFIPVDFVVLEMGEREKAATHPWDAFPQDCGSYHRRRQGGDQVQHQRREKFLQVLTTLRGMQYDQS